MRAKSATISYNIEVTIGDIHNKLPNRLAHDSPKVIGLPRIMSHNNP